MSINECPNCKKIFVRKKDLNYHLNEKKTPCVYNPDKLYKNSQMLTKALEKEPKIKKKDTSSEIIEEIKCEHCLKTFTKKSNLNRHKENYCKEIKKNLDHKDSEIKELLEQLANKDKQIDMLVEQNSEFKKIIVEEKQEHKKETKELHKMIFDLVKKETKKKNNKTNINSINNGTINNTNTANINNGTVNNNITIQFGKEDLSIIDKKHFINLIKSNSTGAKIITDIVKMIHFNDEYPQFQNVCMTDLNRDHILLFDGTKWNTLTNSGDKIIPEIIEKAVGYSHEKDKTFRPVLKTNKKALSRLDVIKKYTVKCDQDHLTELKDCLDPDVNISDINIDTSNTNTAREIVDCEQFIILVSDRVKELIYNEKDNVIKKKNYKNTNKLL
jgi:hypothetical protein